MSIYDLFSISSYIDAFLKIESFENPKIDIVKETHEIKEPIDDFIISLARKNMFFQETCKLR